MGTDLSKSCALWEKLEWQLSWEPIILPPGLPRNSLWPLHSMNCRVKARGWMDKMTETQRGHSSIRKSWRLFESSRKHLWPLTKQRVITWTISAAYLGRASSDQSAGKVASRTTGLEGCQQEPMTLCLHPPHHPKHCIPTTFRKVSSDSSERSRVTEDVLKIINERALQKDLCESCSDGLDGFRMWRTRIVMWHPGVKSQQLEGSVVPWRWRRPEQLPFQRSRLGRSPELNSSHDKFEMPNRSRCAGVWELDRKVCSSGVVSRKVT